MADGARDARGPDRRPGRQLHPDHLRPERGRPDRPAPGHRSAGPRTRPARAGRDSSVRGSSPAAASSRAPVRARAAGVTVAADALIDIRDVTKMYGSGRDRRARAARGVPASRPAIRRDMGSSGSGKSTLMNILGCLDVPSRGRVPARRQRRGRLTERPAGPGPQPPDRLRLPVVQPDPADHRAGQRRAAARLRRHLRRAERRQRRRRARWSWSGSADRAGHRAEPALRRPAAAGRGRPGAGHRPARSCSPTSRPATWTRTRPTRCSACSTSSTPTAARSW